MVSEADKLVMAMGAKKREMTSVSETQPSKKAATSSCSEPPMNVSSKPPMVVTSVLGQALGPTSEIPLASTPVVHDVKANVEVFQVSIPPGSSVLRGDITFPRLLRDVIPTTDREAIHRMSSKELARAVVHHSGVASLLGMEVGARLIEVEMRKERELAMLKHEVEMQTTLADSYQAAEHRANKREDEANRRADKACKMVDELEREIAQVKEVARKALIDKENSLRCLTNAVTIFKASPAFNEAALEKMSTLAPIWAETKEGAEWVASEGHIYFKLGLFRAQQLIYQKVKEANPNLNIKDLGVPSYCDDPCMFDPTPYTSKDDGKEKGPEGTIVGDKENFTK